MKKIGLALGGGGARGLAHIGVLKYLIENNYEIAWISGTSMGAIVGGLYACGLGVDDLYKIATTVDKEMLAKLFFPTLPKTGFIHGDRIVHFLESIIGNPHFEDLSIPFGCVSTDLKTTEEVNHTSGMLINAIRASMSIPVVFTPIESEGRILVDGGLVNPVPVNLCRSLGATKVLAVNVLNIPEEKVKTMEFTSTKKREKRIHSLKDIHDNFKSKIPLINIKNVHFDIKSFLPSPNLGIIDISVKSLFIMESKIADYRLKLDKPDILINPPVGHYLPFDFLKAEEIINIGYEYTKQFMEVDNGSLV